MSLFEEKSTDAQPQEPVATEPNQTETQTQESFLNKLVMEKGENWKDPEVLAKGKIEADSYIKQLEKQLEEMRTDLSKQERMDQILAHLEGKASAATTDALKAPDANTGSTNQDHTSPGISETDLESLVEATLTKREAEATASQNLATVEKQMSEAFGTDAQNKLKQRAQELGLTMERMEGLAKESPSAFMSLMGQADTHKPVNMTRGSVNTESVSMGRNGERDFSYYQKMRRENRSQYYTPKIQQQMMEDRARLGDRFGG